MSETTRYPEQFPWRIIGAFVVAIVAFLWFTTLWKSQAPTLQREYLTDYIRLSVLDWRLSSRYVVIYAGTRVATLSDTGTLVRRYEKRTSAAWKAWLQQDIYEGKSLAYTLRWPLDGAGAILLLLLVLAARRERRARQRARDGRLLRGPELISHWKFNRKLWFNKRNRGFYIEAK